MRKFWSALWCTAGKNQQKSSRRKVVVRQLSPSGDNVCPVQLRPQYQRDGRPCASVAEVASPLTVPTTTSQGQDTVGPRDTEVASTVP